MQTFVKSAGKSARQDYSWAEVSSGDVVQAARDATQDFDQLIGLLDHRTVTLALGRRARDGGVVLVICGLTSKVRRDFNGTLLRSTLVWTAQRGDLAGEERLRSIAAFVATTPTWMLGFVDDLVLEERAPASRGFNVCVNAFEKLWHSLASTTSFEQASGIGRSLPLSDEARCGLAGELGRYRLPDDNGLHVVISPLVDQPFAVGCGIWRALGDRISAECTYPLGRTQEQIPQGYREQLRAFLPPTQQPRSLTQRGSGRLPPNATSGAGRLGLLNLASAVASAFIQDTGGRTNPVSSNSAPAIALPTTPCPTEPDLGSDSITQPSGASKQEEVEVLIQRLSLARAQDDRSLIMRLNIVIWLTSVVIVLGVMIVGLLIGFLLRAG